MDDPETRFTALYDRHYRQVLGYAPTRAGQVVAVDVAGETFLIAWRRLGDVPDPALPGVAGNLMNKQYDRDRRNRPPADRIAVLTTPADLTETATRIPAATGRFWYAQERTEQSVPTKSGRIIHAADL